MDQELARELQLATSDLLDLASLRISHAAGSATASELPATHHAPPPVSIPCAPLFSPGSKLERIYSPLDVRPFSFNLPARHTGRSRGSDVLPKERNDDAEQDHLPTGGLSSKMGSVRGDQQAQQSIILTGPVQTHQHGSLDDPAAVQQRPASRLRERLALDDAYLNEYGERVLNGNVVGRLKGGRRRTHESPSCFESQQQQQHQRDREASNDRGPGSANPSLDSSISRTLASSTTPLASPMQQRYDDKARTRTPPAFFLQSFPDALEPGRRTPSSSTPLATDKLAIPHRGKRASIAERDEGGGGGSLQLRAPRPTARALNFGGDDDEEALDSDNDDDMVSVSSDAASSSCEYLAKPPRQAGSTNDPAFATLTTSSLVTATSSVERRTSRAGSLSSSKRSSIVTTTRTERLELPSVSRRATPTIEVSATQTEHLTLHGNKLQALRSDAGTHQQHSGEAGSSRGTAVRLSTIGSRIEELFHTPLVPAPPRSDQPTKDESEADLNWTCRAARGISASVPSSPTFAHTSLMETDRTSLDSLPTSLLSLPVSTVTCSSSGATSLERRRSGASCDVARRRRARRSGESEEGGMTQGERFAREVKIRGWKEVGAQARGWVVFEVRIISKQGTVITIFRRFSSFVRLRQVLSTEFKDQAKYLPPLPSRRTGLLHKYDAKYLETRRKSLQTWLEVVMLDRVWGASEGLQRWVLDGD